jgi:Leucine-rich repeat (LRR) protein
MTTNFYYQDEFKNLIISSKVIEDPNHVDDLSYHSSTSPHLSNYIADMTNLKSIKINGCNYISHNLLHLAHLQSLEILFASLVNTHYLRYLDRLTSLSIVSCGLNKVPDELINLSNLNHLSISGNKIEYIPQYLYELNKLRTLNLSDNNILEISSDVNHLINLVELNLSHNRLEYVPDEIFRLVSLKKLDLSCNSIVKINPHPVTNDRMLDLNLEHNYIRIFDFVLGLHKLQKLDLGDNKIKRIPKDFHLMHQIRKLSLRRNELNDKSGLVAGSRLMLPPNLFYLNLNNNSLNFLSRATTQIANSLSRLKILDISSADLFNVPEFIFRSSNLKKLNLSMNSLTFLGNIYQLPKLTHLNLSCNLISAVPNNLNQLRQLLVMNFSQNRLHQEQVNQIRLMLPNARHDFRGNFINETRTPVNRNVYTDSENVHTTSITKSVEESFNYLLEKEPVLSLNRCIVELNTDHILSARIKKIIIEYTNNNNQHVITKMTYAKLFCYVWSFIASSDEETATELKKILSDEVKSSIGMCFIGRLTRLLNVLSGFDPRIKISISDTEQISNIIINVKNKLIENDKYTEDLHREQVRAQLKELSYPDSLIEEWIAYIE